MFQHTMENSPADDITRYLLHLDHQPLSFRDVLTGWTESSDFRNRFSQLLADSPYEAFRWETPAWSVKRLDEPFQFALIDAPELARCPPDPQPFQSWLTVSDPGEGFVTFANLGGDATLIVPLPQSRPEVYIQLAAFLRGGPATQVDAMWRFIGKTVQQKLGDEAIWLNTAGGGVAWLHVRLDSRPKYYRYAPYRRLP